MAPKVKFEENLPSGEKITVIIEGQKISKERIVQIMEMIKLLGGFSEENNIKSIKDIIWSSIVDLFGDGTWFSLKDIHSLLSKRLDIKITSLATYLHRFVKEGKLEKDGSRPHTRYRVRKVEKSLYE